MIPRLLVGLAAVLAAALSRRSPRHRPIAVALTVALLGDVARGYAELPPWLDLGLYLITPSAGAWCALRVLGRVGWREAVEGPAVLWVVCWGSALAWPGGCWVAAPHVAHVAALAVQVEAALAWWSSGRPGGLTEACALVLLAGDVVALLGPAGALEGPWWLAATQAGIVGAGLVALQVAALTAAGSRPGEG